MYELIVAVNGGGAEVHYYHIPGKKTGAEARTHARRIRDEGLVYSKQDTRGLLVIPAHQILRIDVKYIG